MKLIPLLAATLLLLSAAALAQEQGDATQGLVYAKQVCAECHTVVPGGGLSDVVDAKSFKSIANRPGMSAMAIGVWMQSEHETMPHIVPAPHDLNDVIAYIVSLKK
jgi:mono/diheme cytochrome c family protein